MGTPARKEIPVKQDSVTEGPLPIAMTGTSAPPTVVTPIPDVHTFPRKPFATTGTCAQMMTNAMKTDFAPESFKGVRMTTPAPLIPAYRNWDVVMVLKADPAKTGMPVSLETSAKTKSVFRETFQPVMTPMCAPSTPAMKTAHVHRPLWPTSVMTAMRVRPQASATTARVAQRPSTVMTTTVAHRTCVTPKVGAFMLRSRDSPVTMETSVQKPQHASMEPVPVGLLSTVTMGTHVQQIPVTPT
jgi:hypothetical protein